MDEQLFQWQRRLLADPEDLSLHKRYLGALMRAGLTGEAGQVAVGIVRLKEGLQGSDKPVLEDPGGACFEVTVAYSDGGNACFSVDKEGGNCEMLWHEEAPPGEIFPEALS